jgi:hypothetical protein
MRIVSPLSFLLLALVGGMFVGCASSNAETTDKSGLSKMPHKEGKMANCPAPKKTDNACAAVAVYVRTTPDGVCCAYGSPCEVPSDGPSFTDEQCTVPKKLGLISLVRGAAAGSTGRR